MNTPKIVLSPEAEKRALDAMYGRPIDPLPPLPAPVLPAVKGSYVTPDGKAQIDFEITYHNGHPHFSASGHYDGGFGQCLDAVKEAYPDDVDIIALHYLWSMYHLKQVEPGTVSQVAELAYHHPFRSFYNAQAESFLSRHELKFRATLSNTKTPPWKDGDGQHGNHYRVTISRAKLKGEQVAPYQGLNRLTFDFWGSISDAGMVDCKECKGEGKVRAEKEELETYPHPAAGQPVNAQTRFMIKQYIKRGMREQAERLANGAKKHPATLTRYVRPLIPCPCCKGSKLTLDPDKVKHPSPYEVLACISGDAHCTESFKNWCADYGYETDSIKAKQMHGRCLAFSKRLQAFFTPAELEQLAEIQ